MTGLEIKQSNGAFLFMSSKYTYFYQIEKLVGVAFTRPHHTSVTSVRPCLRPHKPVTGFESSNDICETET